MPLVVLRLVFFFSGFASLMYQVVWQRLLTVHYGVGAVATTLIVSTYMLGLGLGALVGGALAERVRRRVLFYVAIEWVLGVFGAASPWLLDFLGRRTAGASYPASLACMAAFLALPTLLMGATLPLLTKIVNTWQRDFLKSLSFLYFVNTLGAAAGALFASYVAISFWGLDGATYLAAGINLALAAVIYAVARPMEPTAATGRTTPFAPADGARAAVGPAAAQVSHRDADVAQTEIGGEGALGRWAYLCVFVTGFLAIGCEILWFRVLGVFLKDSPYAFSTILAVYLLGVALGSFGMVWYQRRKVGTRGRAMFFLLQALIGVYLAATLAGFCHLFRHNARLQEGLRDAFWQTLHPPPWDAHYEAFGPWLFQMTDVLIFPAIFVLVPTLLMGASFPLVTTLALRRPDREASAVGTVYFFNILGNVAGGIVTGYGLLEWLGTERTALAFSLASFAMLVFADRLGPWRWRPAWRAAAALGLAMVTIAVFPGKGEFYRMVHPGPPEGMQRHLQEGMDAVVVTDASEDAIHNYINGLNHGHRPGYWYLREAVEAFAYARRCRDVLVIGFGAGTFTETALLLDEVERLTLVEISPTLLANLRKIELYRRILSDPRIRLVVEDGRRWLLQSGQTYDMILIDPLRTTTSHSNNLYSLEFFALLRRHLTPEGLFLAWMDDDRVFPKTVASAFPYVRMYELNPRPYFMGFCLASPSPMTENAARKSELLQKIPAEMHARIMAYGAYVGDQETIFAMTAGYPINRDWRPVLEYYFWRNRQRQAWERTAPPASPPGS
jgi:spermidine synthase